MKFLVLPLLAVGFLVALAEVLSEIDCKNIEHAKKGYNCHCESETKVGCVNLKLFVDPICEREDEYYDKDLSLYCTCNVEVGGYLNCIKKTEK